MEKYGKNGNYLT